jgi:hypothetical protein
MICTPRRRVDEGERRARVEAIRDAALARAALGQAAVHRRLADGEHEIGIYDRRRGQLRQHVAATLAEAIAMFRRSPVSE